MKHIKSFKVFESVNNEEMTALKTILSIFKSELYGNIEHPSEYFDDGSHLVELAEKSTDEKIKNILLNIAEFAQLDADGSSEHIFDFLSEDDVNYITDYLGLPPMKFDENDYDDEDYL